MIVQALLYTEVKKMIDKCSGCQKKVKEFVPHRKCYALLRKINYLLYKETLVFIVSHMDHKFHFGKMQIQS